jgi:hypothetical protein
MAYDHSNSDFDVFRRLKPVFGDAVGSSNTGQHQQQSRSQDRSRFPKTMIGKRVRFKIEVLDDEPTSAPANSSETSP